MAHPIDELPVSTEERTSRKEPAGAGSIILRRCLLVCAVTLVLLLVVGTVVLIVEWPFTREKIAQHLGEATGTKVEFKNFRAMHFPYPGCVAEALEFKLPTSNVPPLITMARLTIRGSYLDLFTRHVAVMTAEGMHVVIPPFGTNWANNRSKSKVVIHVFRTDGATLDFTRAESKPPLRFAIHTFELHELGSDDPMAFQSFLHIPLPPAEVQITGQLGPWESQSSSETPLEGSYTLMNGNFDSFGGIKGNLSSEGKFAGILKRLQVQGVTNTPNFGADGSDNRLPLQSQYQTVVNATDGDITLQSVKARLGNTAISATGAIRGTPNQKGKTVDVNLAVQDGRVEDVLGLFAKKESPMIGTISFRAHARIPPDSEPFLKKVELQGRFGITHGQLTSSHSQRSMDTLSADARGAKDKKKAKEDPERVFSNLSGNVTLKSGIADFKGLEFAVPGAVAHMGGTFNVLNERVDMKGTLQMQAKLSNATSGIKSFIVKLIDPFIHKDHSQAPLPVSITGTYDHPRYQVSPTKKQ
ncbi:MAG TPA: AsmA-like C-terminal region-containing protein [Terriglobales bacterium]|nr:AsmA-like C-terminal region-containing protein [Terriglobales bacterium]